MEFLPPARDVMVIAMARKKEEKPAARKTPSPPPGGPANINGVLYQVLGALDRAAKLTLTVAGAETDPTRIIIIEPAHGGDLQYVIWKQRHVEQWKARGDARTWSLQSVLNDVWPDLYLAVPSQHAATRDRYIFVTEGRRGRWGQAEKMLDRARNSSMPADPVTVWDHVTKYHFFNNETCTERELFLRIVARVREHVKNIKGADALEGESEQETARKVWRLLSAFEMSKPLPKAKLIAAVTRQIEEIVDHIEDADAVRCEACTRLMELATQGSVIRTPRELMNEIGLRARSFRHWAPLRSALNGELSTIVRRRGYDANFDVRPVDLKDGKRITVLAGPSGSGKTWAMASLALRRQIASEELCIWVAATGDADKDVAAVADAIWLRGLDHDQTMPMERVARRRETTLPTPPADPWFAAYVDGVADVIEARSLIEDHSWDRWHGTLTMSTTTDVGDILERTFPNDVNVIRIPRFNQDQLRALLSLHHRDWADIPHELREILKLPFLAGLFCQLTAENVGGLVNEYTLLAAFWKRLFTAKEQIAHPGDATLLRRLVLDTFSGASLYPWPAAALYALNGSQVVDAWRIRLEAIGWLQHDGNDGAAMPHERLLNWATAEALVEQWRAGEIKAAELAGILAEFARNTSRTRLSLDFLPLDVLWLASDPSLPIERRTEAFQFLAAIDAGEIGFSVERLYADLLPHFGPRIIPLILDRLRLLNDQHDHFLWRYSADALKAIGHNWPLEVQRTASTILDDPLQGMQDVALRVLARYPMPSRLDRIWQIHTARTADSRGNARSYHSYELSHAALIAAIRLDCAWLKRQIANASTGEKNVNELTAAVASLDGPDAPAVWSSVKADLFTKSPSGDFIELTNCISRYADRAESGRLTQWLEHTNGYNRGAVFSALARLDPEAAVSYVEREDVTELTLFRGQWLPELMMRHPERTRAALLSAIRRSGDAAIRQGQAFAGYESVLDDQTLDALLDALEATLDRITAPQPPGGQRPLWAPLQLLANIWSGPALGRFALRREESLEQKLGDVAVSWVGRQPGYHDHELEFATTILLKIGGKGFTRLINAHLRHPAWQVVLGGLRSAAIRPDNETRQLVRQVGLSDILVEGSPRPSPLLQFEAVRAACALHDDAMFVDIVLKHGRAVVSHDVSFLRAKHPPFDDLLTKTIDTQLMTKGAPQYLAAVLLAGYSKRKEFIPLLREIFRQAPIQSELALNAMLALQDLEDYRPELASSYIPYVLNAGTSHIAINAIFRCGDAKTLDWMEQQIISASELTSISKSGPAQGLGRHRVAIALALARNPARRRRMAEQLWASLRGSFSFLIENEAYELVGELNDPLVREFLWEHAFPPAGAFHVVGRVAAAIRGLAKVEPAAAFQAAVKALGGNGRDREWMPALVTELDHRGGLAALCRAMAIEDAIGVRWEIARVLRCEPDRSAVGTAVRGMLADTHPGVRLAGVELAGWQEDCLEEAAVQLLIEDTDQLIRNAAVEAVNRRHNHRIGLDMINRLATARTSSEAYALVTGIIRCVDPYLPFMDQDIFGFLKAIGNMPPFLARAARMLAEDRQKEIDKEAERGTRSSALRAN
jgi:hypothetical protein